jgi:hypothetical protein
VDRAIARLFRFELHPEHVLVEPDRLHEVLHTDVDGDWAKSLDRLHGDSSLDEVNGARQRSLCP